LTRRFQDWPYDKLLRLRQEAIGKKGDGDWLFTALQDGMIDKKGNKQRIVNLQPVNGRKAPRVFLFSGL
jgi:hypothetical protein